jgi:enoyl-CoA hydratase/carnithine racemase
VEYKEIIYEIRNQTAWIYLNRPKAMNSLNTQLIFELSDALQNAEKDDNVRVLVLSGKGKAFCAGADLTAVMGSIKDPDLRGPDFLSLCETTFNGLRNFSKPVIAATNGMTLAGGLELTMCCDLVIAAKSAKLGDAHSNFGVFPGAGGAAVLPKKIGLARAKYLLFTGDFISADEMMEFGLVNQVVEDENLEESVQKIADKLSQKSPLVLSRMKKVANDSMDQTQKTALRNELLTLRDHLRSYDVHEGIAAFTEKRSPKFKGK